MRVGRTRYDGHMEIRRQLLELGSLLPERRLSCPCSAGYSRAAGAGCQDTLSPPPVLLQEPWYDVCTPPHFLTFLHGFWGWNSGEQACTASTFACWAISVVPALIYFFKSLQGTGETAQWLRVLTALVGDQSSVPSTCLRQFTTSVIPAPRTLTPWGSYGYLHIRGTCRLSYTYTHQIEINQSF